MSIVEEIKKLKEERDAVILAHYYVDGPLQAVADYVGDSYYLSKKANEAPQQTIVFCGVQFMGESAKIMNPEKTVLIPDETADCPMAHMATEERIKQVREDYDDLAVVCYINSTAETKANSDICVTSSNAVDIVTGLPNKNIYFVPDENLARYIAGKLPDKHFIFNDGYCYVHKDITPAAVQEQKDLHPGVQVLAHPECKKNVLDMADYVGSTSGIIEYTAEKPAKEFIICTEKGILYELQKKSPDKEFYFAGESVCKDMKKITLEKLRDCLKNMEPQIPMDETLRRKALTSLERMHGAR